MFGIRRKKSSNKRPDLMIVGLGNPGPEYDGTRHNVGFQVIDEIAKANKLKLATFNVHARYTTWEHEGRAVLLVKPMTFMNRSGQAVGALARQYSLEPEKVLVVGDDLDLSVGVTRMKPKGGSGGHNGHKSVAAALGSDSYPRIKIGIGKAGETVDHVLSRFSPAEKAVIEKSIARAVESCRLFVTNGVEDAMQFCNTD